MRAVPAFTCLIGVAVGTMSGGDAQARARRHPMSAPLAAAPETTPWSGPAWLTPADRAKSGWIDGASPWNPEGSSNPQVPNNS